MRKRLVAGPLGFLATLCTHELARRILGAPRAVGPVIEMVVATLVILYPADLMSPDPPPARPVGDLPSPGAAARPQSSGRILD